MITLRKLTQQNLKECINLELDADEKGLLFPNVYLVPGAKLYPGFSSRAIYTGNTMVGYIKYGEDKRQKEVYHIDKLMICRNHRGKGYATDTLKAILAEANVKGYLRVSTSAKGNNLQLQKILLKNGFYSNGEISENKKMFYYVI